jgi:hypothetical protein
MPFTNYAIETFISARITELTDCRITDLGTEFPNASKWVSGFGLCVIFANQPPQETRAFALQFVRRVEMAIAEYVRMRAEIQDLLSGDPRWSPYYRALHHGEVAVSMLYQAYDLSRKKMNVQFFESNDGSPLQRLNLIYTTSKHQLAEGQDPLWLSNDGFHAEQGTLLYSEFEELARSCARVAEQLCTTSNGQTQSSDA